jgi:hypothetical protein
MEIHSPLNPRIVQISTKLPSFQPPNLPVAGLTSVIASCQIGTAGFTSGKAAQEESDSCLSKPHAMVK